MKNEKKLSIMQNMLWNTVGSFVYLLCQWLLTLIVVRMSDTMANAGSLSLAISVTNIFYTIACFNVRPYLVSDVKHVYTMREYSGFRITTCGIALAACGIYISCFGYSSQQFAIIFLYMIFKLGEAWVDFLHGMEQKSNRMDIGGISLFIRGILSLASFSLVLYVTDDICLSIIVMTILTWGFILLYDNPMAMKFDSFMPKFNFAKIKSMFLEFLPLTIGSCSRAVSANFPRQILEAQFGNEVLGIYGTVATPAVIVQVAATYVFNPVLTKFAELYDKDDKKSFVRLVLKISGVLLLLTLVCLAGAALLGEWGLVLIYGESIREYTDLFLLVIVYTCLNAYAWFFWSLLIVMRKMKSLLVICVIEFIVCISIVHPMIAAFYMNGVSLALIVDNFITVLLMAAVVGFEVKKKR